MSSSDIRPSRWFYAFGLLIIATGVVYAPSYLVSSLHNLDNEMQQLLTPDGNDILLQKSGEYIIYASKSIPGLEIEISNKSSGSNLATSGRSIERPSGKSASTFTIAEPGVYEIRPNYPNCTECSQVVLALERDQSGDKFSTILYAAVLFFGSVLVGVAMIAITYLKRQK